VIARQSIRLGSAGERDWGRRPVAIVGGGPSLNGFDFERLRDRFTVLAVNASMFDLPWADAGFSIDRRAARIWWPRLRALAMPVYLAMPDPYLVNFDGPPAPSMRFVRRVPGTALTSWGWQISAGGTSGFGALHLAFLKGAKRITLFGFDYGTAGPAWHHNEQHYAFPHRQCRADWTQWAKNFERAAYVLTAHGVSVINASPGSAIEAFPRVSLEEALK
jgi:hypothetical protein